MKRWGVPSFEQFDAEFPLNNASSRVDVIIGNGSLREYVNLTPVPDETPVAPSPDQV